MPYIAKEAETLMLTAGIAKVISYLGMLASVQMCRTEMQFSRTVCKTLGLISRKEKKGDPTKKKSLPSVQMFPH